MDEQQFDEAVERLKKVNDVISGLDEAIRGDAFELLKPYVTEKAVKGISTGTKTDEHETLEDSGFDADDVEAFFDKHQSDKDADHAHAAAAFWYSKYGKAPFHLDDLRRIARDGGADLPERLDMTIGAAKREKKALYRRSSTGRYRPTPHGERYLKATYSVTKGREVVPVANDAE